jgi:hypothetical protein
MQLSNVLFMLLGAGLLGLGILAAAIADRIRGIRAAREATPRDRTSRVQTAPVPTADPAPALKPVRMVRAEPKTDPKINAEIGDEVIAALVGFNIKKSIATEATWACPAGERASIEGWTAAALRRCARGGAS